MYLKTNCNKEFKNYEYDEITLSISILKTHKLESIRSEFQIICIKQLLCNLKAIPISIMEKINHFHAFVVNKVKQRTKIKYIKEKSDLVYFCFIFKFDITPVFT